MIIINNEKKIFLHIGFYKTGSTNLQKNIFEKINDKKFFVSTKEKNENIVLDLINILKNKNDFTDFQKKINSIEEENILISHEGLFGSFFNGFIQKNYRFHQMEKIFNKPNYIICFREPSSLIFSLYKERVKHGLIEDFDNFVNYDLENLYNQKINDKPDNIRPSEGTSYKNLTNYKLLDYNELLIDYLNISERVLFLDFNDLSLNREQFYQKIAQYIKLNFSIIENKEENRQVKNIEYFKYFNNFLVFKIIKIFFLYLIKFKKKILYPNYSKKYFYKRYMEAPSIILLISVFAILAKFLRIKSFYNYKKNIERTNKKIKEYHEKSYKSFKNKLLNN